MRFNTINFEHTLLLVLRKSLLAICLITFLTRNRPKSPRLTVPLEDFTRCLIALCDSFWCVVYSCHKTMEWHQLNKRPSFSNEMVLEDEEPCGRGEWTADDEFGLHHNMEMFDVQYTRSKLKQGLVRLWQDVQKKVKLFLCSSNFALFKYDEFISILDIISRLIEIGEEFCLSKSEDLQETVKNQTVNYFKAFHRSTLDELKMFLEHEAWELGPVTNNFSIHKMREFHFLHLYILDSKRVFSLTENDGDQLSGLRNMNSI